MKLLEKRSKNLIYNKEVIAVFFSAGFISFALKECCLLLCKLTLYFCDK